MKAFIEKKRSLDNATDGGNELKLNKKVKGMQLCNLTFNTTEKRITAFADIIISQGDRLEIQKSALLDTGAEANFISHSFVKKWNIKLYPLNIAKINNSKSSTATEMHVCGAINGSDCTAVNKIARVRINHIGTVITPYEIEFIVGDFDHDVVIGLTTLKQHNILLGYPGSFFSLDSPEVVQFLNDMVTVASAHVQETQTPAANVEREVEKNSGYIEVNGSVSEDVRRRDDSSIKATCRCTCNGQCTSKNSKPEITLATLNRELNVQSTFSDNYVRDVYSKEDIWEIPDTMLEAIPSDLLYASENEPIRSNTSFDEFNIPTQIFGPESLQRAIRRLLVKYKHIFSREINPVPAKLKPFGFRIDESQWQQPGNHTNRRQ